MPKPIRDTFLGRIFLLLRGIIFYNTVYWKRASDGLKPPRLTRREREERRPPRDLSTIKPREKPRAKVVPGEEAEPPESLPPPAPKGFAKVSSKPPAALAPVPPNPPPVETANGEIVRKKRRRVRLQTSHTALDLFNGPSLGSKGLLDRFFKKKG